MKLATAYAEKFSVYINDYMDEMIPDDLEGWAKFLANSPDCYWHREDEDAGAQDGQEFAATIVTYRYVPAHRQPDGSYSIVAAEDGWIIQAVAYSEFGGWSPEMILSRSDDLIRKLIAEGRQATDEEDAVDAIRQAGQMLAEIGDEDVEYLVHRRVAEQDAVVTYRANPPRCEMHIKETA